MFNVLKFHLLDVHKLFINALSHVVYHLDFLKPRPFVTDPKLKSKTVNG